MEDSDTAGEPTYLGAPWGGQPSIYEHLRTHVHPEVPGLLPGGETLPDSKRYEMGKTLRYAAGAEEAIFSHHWRTGQNSSFADEVAAALDRIVAHQSGAPAALYDLITAADSRGYREPLRLELQRRAKGSIERYEDIGRWLAFSSADREAVKLGIALLGLPAINGFDLDALLVLSRHDEFTSHVVGAITTKLKLHDLALLEVGKNVTGWGRIDVIERLEDSTHPDVRRWLLREGSYTSIMSEYIAYICATTGGLAEALDTKESDAELFAGARRILGALIRGGPARDISSYADGIAAIERFLRLARRQDKQVKTFHLLDSIQRFCKWGLAEPQKQRKSPYFDRLTSLGWNVATFDSLLAECADQMSDSGWRETFQLALRSPDINQIRLALIFSRTLGIDPYPRWKMLLQEGENFWDGISQHCDLDPARVAELASIAEETIIPRITPHLSGWSSLLHSHGRVIEILREYPGVGWPVVVAGLGNPIARVRKSSLTCIREWGRQCLPQDATGALKLALASETDAAIQAEIEQTITLLT